MPPDNPDSSQRLLDRLRHGEEEAFRSLVEHWHPRVIGFLMVQLNGNRDLAEDVAQDTFIAMWKQRAQLRSAESLPAWLFRVANRKAHHARSSARPAAAALTEDHAAQAPAPTPRDHAEAGDLHSVMSREIAQLSSHEQLLVTLRFFGGLSYRELAEITGSPIGSVGTQLTRALTKLRTRLEQQGLRPEDLLS